MMSINACRRHGKLSHASSVVLALFCWLTLPAVAGAQETIFSFDPASTKVAFTLPATLHTVHGTMKLKSGEIRFDPATGNASGQVIADATSAETGNPSRDRKMHKSVLESARYPEVVFTAERVTGVVQPTGLSQLQLSGQFLLHGQQHPMTLAVNLDRGAGGQQATATTKFTIPYVQWGLKNPSTLFLRVSRQLDMEIDAAGHITQSAQ